MSINRLTKCSSGHAKASHLLQKKPQKSRPFITPLSMALAAKKT